MIARYLTQLRLKASQKKCVSGSEQLSPKEVDCSTAIKKAPSPLLFSLDLRTARGKWLVDLSGQELLLWRRCTPGWLRQNKL